VNDSDLRFTSVVLLAFTTLCVSGCAGYEHTADYWVQQGNEYYNNTSYEKALDCYNNAIEIDPQSTDAWANKCRTLSRQRNEYGLASVDHILKAKYTAANKESSEYNLEDEYDMARTTRDESNKKFSAAIEACNKTIEIDPKCVQALVSKGDLLVSQGEYNESLEIYNTATEIDPGYAPAWEGKGWVLNLLHRYEESIPAFDKALEINPQYTAARNWRENSLNNLGH
jgi:superkiller protein 3